MKPLTDIKIKVSWATGILVMGKFNLFFFISAPKGVVSQMMKDPLSLIEDKTLANEVHQVRCHKKFTAVKCRACARGSILVGRAPISRAKFKGRHKKKITVSSNKRRKIETFTEISQRNKSSEKENSRQSLFKYLAIAPLTKG